MRLKLPVTALAVAAMVLTTALPASSQPREVSAQDGASVGDLQRSLTPPSDMVAASTGQVTVYGGGWGHGIGMSQWGAHAMATAGKNHEEILQHFYAGIQFGAIAPAGNIVQHADPIRVGVGPNRVSVSFIPQGGPAELCINGVIDPNPDDDVIPASCFTAQQGEQWFIYGTESQPNTGDTCLITRGSEPMAESTLCHGNLTWSNQPGVRMNFPGIGRTYARGSVAFDPIFVSGVPNGRFHVNVVLTMDEYLYGLGEVPSSWPMEAMKAQVVAARSFALYRIFAIRNLPSGILAECDCHLRSTTVDQSYLGWHTGGMTEGTSSSGASWRQAVDQTSGKALWHPQHPVTRAAESYYFSSTGGATENNEDRWGGTPYQYLRSRNDPGATSWSKGFTYTGFATALGFSSVSWVEITDRYQSGRPKNIMVQGIKNGSQTTQNYAPGAFQSALGLLSQYVTTVSGLLHPDADRVVLHNPSTGQWSYRLSNGNLQTIYYGNPDDYAIFGDWDCDGIDTPGLFRQKDGYVYLRNSNTQGVADISFYFGNPGDVPIVGDFNGDGCDTVSIYRPSLARFYIINQLGSSDKGLGAAEYWFTFGNVGDSPLVGDWDGDGVDTPGVRRPSNGFVYLRNSNSGGLADIEFAFGSSNDLIVVGDWNGDGSDSLGIYRPSTGQIQLRHSLSGGPADITYQMGSSLHRPVAGKY